jgi:NADH-quinone oxidoreductase subunit L
MILAMGVGSWVGGLFHLITHAFFKALLFLGSGSVIHAAHHEQELPQYGGLIRKIPVTAITFLIAVFAIAGFGVAGWGFSGFYSKDMILEHAAAFGLASSGEKFSWYWLLFWCPAIIAYVTPFYMMRCWTLTFAGKPRNQHLHDHAHESAILYIPLIILAVASVFGGKIYVDDLIKSAQTEMNIQVGQGKNLFASAWPVVDHKKEADADVTDPTPVDPNTAKARQFVKDGHTKMHHALAGGFAWAISIALGFLVYMNGYSVVNKLMKIPGAGIIHTWLYRRMYFDELYKFVFVGTVKFLSYIANAFDRFFIDAIVNAVASLGRKASWVVGKHDEYVVDGAVNGAASLAQTIGAAVRNPASGRIRLYVTVLMCVVAVGIAAGIVVALSR